MSTIEIEHLWNLLNTKKIQIKTDTNSNYSCVICGNILIDCRLGICGCQYCKKCITAHLANGEQFCPGSKDECKENCLSDDGNISCDNLLNNKILMLIATCPVENCLYECELKNMNEHLRVCLNKKSFCPFYEFGCKLKSISENQMIDHLEENNETHSRIIIEVINNLSNEMKRIEEKHFNEINQLKIDVKNKDEKFENSQQLFNAKMERLEKQIRDDSQIKMDIINQLLKENLNLKSELEILREEMDSSKVEIKLVGTKLLSEIGLLVWKIDNLSERRKNKCVLTSDYFYSIDGHKLTLYLYCNGCGKNIEGDHLSLKIYMSNYQCNQSCFCCCNVLVEIIDQTTGDPIHEIKLMKVNISKGKASPPFHFLYSNLSIGGTLKNDSIIIKCQISC